MYEVISGQRDQLMMELRTDLDRVMRESVGLEVVDVRVKKIDLPPEVSTTVYERMNSEREIEARQYRAEGQEQALAIRAKADRDAVVIEAEAYRESELLRGDGDAKAAQVYAGAFNQDPNFTGFIEASMLTAKSLRIRAICWCLIRKRLLQVHGKRRRKVISPI